MRMGITEVVAEDTESNYVVVNLHAEGVRWLRRFRIDPTDPEAVDLLWELVVGFDVFLTGTASRGEWIDCFADEGGLPVCAIPFFDAEIRIRHPLGRSGIRVELEDTLASPPPAGRVRLITPAGDIILVSHGEDGYFYNLENRKCPVLCRQCAGCGAVDFCASCARCDACGWRR